MTNVLTDDEAKQAVGKGALDSSKAELLAVFNTGVTQALEDRYGPIVYGTVTAELHSGGCGQVWLKYRPVVQVNQVVEYDGTTAGTLSAETNASKPTDAYLVNLENGKLMRRDTGGPATFPDGIDNVSVTYVAGRFAAGTIDSQFKMAASIMLKNAWSAYENSVVSQDAYDVPQARFPTFAIPKFVQEALARDQQSGSGVGD